MKILRRSNHPVHDDDADRESCRVPALTVVALVALAAAALTLLHSMNF